MKRKKIINFFNKNSINLENIFIFDLKLKGCTNKRRTGGECPKHNGLQGKTKLGECHNWIKHLGSVYNAAGKSEEKKRDNQTLTCTFFALVVHFPLSCLAPPSSLNPFYIKLHTCITPMIDVKCNWILIYSWAVFWV